METERRVSAGHRRHRLPRAACLGGRQRRKVPLPCWGGRSLASRQHCWDLPGAVRGRPPERTGHETVNRQARVAAQSGGRLHGMLNSLSLLEIQGISQFTPNVPRSRTDLALQKWLQHDQFVARQRKNQKVGFDFNGLPARSASPGRRCPGDGRSLASPSLPAGSAAAGR